MRVNMERCMVRTRITGHFQTTEQNLAAAGMLRISGACQGHRARSPRAGKRRHEGVGKARLNRTTL